MENDNNFKIKAGKRYIYWLGLDSLTNPMNGFSNGHIYKSNLDGHLQNDSGDNVAVKKVSAFIEYTDPYMNIKKPITVDHMDYYEGGRKITPFDVIIDWDLDFFIGNVLKYIARLGRKPGVDLTREEKDIQDIDKMIVYLNKEKEKILKYKEK